VYLSVEDVTRLLLRHLKGQRITAIPIGKDKILDGIGTVSNTGGGDERGRERWTEWRGNCE
jgi:hypothetical protein